MNKSRGDEEEEQKGLFLGRRKVGFDEDVPLRRPSIYPLARQNGSNSFHAFTATLMDPFSPSKAAVIDGPNCQAEIEILQNMVSGCFLWPQLQFFVLGVLRLCTRRRG